MPGDVVGYPRYRFPSAIISHAVSLYYCFTLSLREWKTSLRYAVSPSRMNPSGTRVRLLGSRTHGGFSSGPGQSATRGIWTKLFVTIRGRRQYLWRAVDQDGEVLDILLQPRRDRHAAARFFRTLLKPSGRLPRWPHH